MASVIFDLVHLTDPADPTWQLVSGSRERSDDADTPATLLVGADGRRRLLVLPGDSNTLGVTLVNLTRSQQQDLDTRRGRLLLLRDRHGRKLYGAFTSRRVTDHPGLPLACDVTFTFISISHDEQVA